MILVLASFLVVVHHMIVDLPEAFDYRLFIAGILATCHLAVELVHYLVTVTEIVLNSCSARLVVEHVEHLAKVHRCAIGSTISDQPEHNAVCVVLELDILVHPNLA
ncbi:AC5 [Sida yellow golden mosaic virus]|uniref:AC5 n=1 Tax=Sida yellow golden mosaic virus TaxID=2174902 RepID=A0A2S1FWM7_9GEMI|nr:AC5 [Sida yellow golden mosaic virus]AWD77153.1 AC5 [Sida yellow golden mosaic virus]